MSLISSSLLFMIIVVECFLLESKSMSQGYELWSHADGQRSVRSVFLLQIGVREGKCSRYGFLL